MYVTSLRDGNSGYVMKDDVTLMSEEHKKMMATKTAAAASLPRDYGHVTSSNAENVMVTSTPIESQT